MAYRLELRHAHGLARMPVDEFAAHYHQETAQGAFNLVGRRLWRRVLRLHFILQT